MMSQAYMLVYVRKTEIENTLQPIDLSTVDPGIVQRVRAENEKLKKSEFWYRNRLFYLVLPEMLRGTAFWENILGFESHFEHNDRIDRLLRDVQKRYCLVVPKDDSLSELFKQIQALLELDWSQILVYRYDNYHRRLFKVICAEHLSKNGTLDLKSANKRLRRVFKNDSEETYTVLYLDFVDPHLRKKTFCEPCPPRSVMSEEFADAFGDDEVYSNCCQIKPSHPPKPSEDKLHFMRFASNEDVLHLVKRFSGGNAPSFFGTFTGGQTVTQSHLSQWLAEEFDPLETVAYTEVYYCRQPFIMYHPLKVFPETAQQDPDSMPPHAEDCVIVTFMNKPFEKEYLHLIKNCLYNIATVFFESEDRLRTSARLDIRMKLPDLFRFIWTTRLQGEASPDHIGLRVIEQKDYDEDTKTIIFNTPDSAHTSLQEIIERTCSGCIEFFVSKYDWKTLRSRFNIDYCLYSPESARLLHASRLFDKSMLKSELLDHLRDMFESHLKQMSKQLRDDRQSLFEVS